MGRASSAGHLQYPSAYSARSLGSVTPEDPFIASSADSNVNRKREMDEAGARVLYIPAGPDGRVSLPVLLERLEQLSLKTLMVEAGSKVITSFVRKRLASLAAPALV